MDREKKNESDKENEEEEEEEEWRDARLGEKQRG